MRLGVLAKEIFCRGDLLEELAESVSLARTERIVSRSDAIRRLVEMGLAQENS